MQISGHPTLCICRTTYTLVVIVSNHTSSHDMHSSSTKFIKLHLNYLQCINSQNMMINCKCMLTDQVFRIHKELVHVNRCMQIHLQVPGILWPPKSHPEWTTPPSLQRWRVCRELTHTVPSKSGRLQTHREWCYAAGNTSSNTQGKTQPWQEQLTSAKMPYSIERQ